MPAFWGIVHFKNQLGILLMCPASSFSAGVTEDVLQAAPSSPPRQKLVQNGSAHSHLPAAPHPLADQTSELVHAS